MQNSPTNVPCVATANTERRREDVAKGVEARVSACMEHERRVVMRAEVQTSVRSIYKEKNFANHRAVPEPVCAKLQIAQKFA